MRTWLTLSALQEFFCSSRLKWLQRILIYLDIQKAAPVKQCPWSINCYMKLYGIRLIHQFHGMCAHLFLVTFLKYFVDPRNSVVNDSPTYWACDLHNSCMLLCLHWWLFFFLFLRKTGTSGVSCFIVCLIHHSSDTIKFWKIYCEKMVGRQLA